MKKTITNLVLVLLTTTISLNAQSFGYSEEMLNKVEENVVNSLNHEVSSIAESAIFNLVLLKNKYPQDNFEIFISELDELSLEAEVSTIKYKAQLTSWYLRNADKFGLIEIENKDEANKYFNEIADKIQSNLIASK